MAEWLPKFIRNNNHGNIICGNWAVSKGAIGKDPIIGFAIFTDWQIGKDAIYSLLATDRYKNLTLNKTISTCAPPSENDTAAYQSFVSSKIGVSNDTVISSLSQEQLDSLASAIIQMEGIKIGSAIGSVIDNDFNYGTPLSQILEHVSQI